MSRVPLEIVASVRARRDSGDVRGALALLRTIDLSGIEDVHALVVVGLAFRDLDQLSEALDVFDLAVARDPHAAGAHSARARLLVSVGRFHEAESAFATSIALAPTAPRWVMRGDVQLTLGRDVEAEESFREALLLDPSDDEALYNLALVLRERDVHQAVALLQESCRIDPLCATYHRELGFALLVRGDSNGAEHELGTAIEIDPSDAWSWIYLSELEKADGRFTDARGSLQKAQVCAPLWIVPVYLLGMLEERLGNSATALALFQEARERDTQDPNASFHLARFLAESGRAAEAIAVLRSIAESDMDPRTRALLTKLTEQRATPLDQTE